MSKVPEPLVGLWHRTLLQDAHGEDRATEVYWLQSHDLYVDLRIPPAESPAIIASSHSAHIDWLLRHEGFAGRLEVDGDVAEWHRWIDYQPPDGKADSGRLQWAGPDSLQEEGVHRAYYEEWERVPVDTSRVIVMQLDEELDRLGHSYARSGVFIAMGDVFMYALDRPNPLSEACDLRSVYRDAAEPLAILDTILACEVGYGHHVPGNGWTIDLCTLPQRRGALMPMPRDLPRLGSLWEQRFADGVRRWEVLEAVGEPHAQ